MSKILKLRKSEFEKLITNVATTALESKIKELGLDKVDRKFGISGKEVTGKTEKELLALDKGERVAQFIKAVFDKDKALIRSIVGKAQNEGTGSAGGFSVPEEFAAEIARIAEDFGLVRKFARKITMKTDTMNMPRLGSSVTVSFPGEGAAGTSSDFVEQNVQLLAKTLVGINVMSNELLEDANVDLAQFVLELFAEEMAGEEDKQGLVGIGSPFTGILGDAGVNVFDMGTGSTAFTDVTLDDLRDTIAKLKPLALNGAAWTMHRSVWSIIQKLKDNDAAYHISAANPVLLPGDTGGAIGGVIVGSVWGYPVWLSEKMPADTGAPDVSKKFISFGNYNKIWFGDRKQITMRISEDATVTGEGNVFEQNQAAVRVTERFAIAVGLPDGFAVVKTAAA